jgi:hypothetical protein
MLQLLLRAVTTLRQMELSYNDATVQVKARDPSSTPPGYGEIHDAEEFQAGPKDHILTWRNQLQVQKAQAGVTPVKHLQRLVPPPATQNSPALEDHATFPVIVDMLKHTAFDWINVGKNAASSDKLLFQAISTACQQMDIRGRVLCCQGRPSGPFMIGSFLWCLME